MQNILSRLTCWFAFTAVLAATFILGSCSGTSTTSTGTAPSAPGPKPTPTISWPTPAPISNPTPLGPTQLDATANVAGTFVYSPSSGTVLTAGTYTLSVTFTPNDTTKYNAATASVTITVNPSNNPQKSPVAYVYVSSMANSQILAFSADANGTLSPVLGSPFPASAAYMAVNGKFLFANDPTDTNISSFTIASNGALQQVSTINASHYNPGNTGGPEDLFLDHTGTTLYDGDIYAYGTQSNAYESFSIDSSTGQLNFLGITPDGGPNVDSVLSFIGNNVFAYSSSCFKSSPEIFGYRRNADQTLSPLNINPSIPAAPSGAYCPFFAAADASNNVAISLTPFSVYSQAGQPQLAVYTADGSGNLTTLSNSTNMPTSAVGLPTDLQMAPSSTLLAIAGTSGLQLFHFNGGQPITSYTGLLTTSQVDQVWWDNANHLYALSRSAGLLYVFAATTTSVTQAPGSPYTIASPQNLAVLPKT